MSSPTDLPIADVRLLLDCVAALYGSHDESKLQHVLVAQLNRLCPAETVHFNEVDVARGRSTAVTNVPDPDAVRHIDVFAAHAAEHPRIDYYIRTLHNTTCLISDFTSRAAFEETGIYREFYAPNGHADIDQASLMLPTPDPARFCVTMAINRKWGQFTERDRTVLNLFLPHVEQAYHNAVAMTRYRDLAAAATGALDAVSMAAARVDASGRLTPTSPAVGRWLSAYFPGRPHDGLPARVRRWLAGRGGGGPRSAGRHLAPLPPLVADGPGGRLTVRLVRQDDDGGVVLLFREDVRPTDAAPPLPPGLSPREAQVFRLLLTGLSEKQIAFRLGLSAHTVHDYVKGVYRAAGVSARVELVARFAAAAAAGD